GDLIVGDSGVGTLSITGGGKVSNYSAVLGAIAYTSSGTVNVDGAGSTWTNSADLIVGKSGTGTLNITGGGKVSGDSGYLGKDATGAGTAMVQGAGSAWTSTGVLMVGDYGSGGLTILNGGAVSNTLGVIGNQTGSNGTVLVDGAGSTWTNSASLFVGATGTGSLTVSNGADVTNTVGYIGGGAAASGTVTVTGAGSTWTNSGNLLVGSFGGGTLTISNGGTVSSQVASIGSSAGSVGAATVTGAGSTLNTSSSLYVGADGDGTLTIANGGTVNALGGVGITGDAASKGTLNIGGAEGAAAAAAGILNTTGVQFGAGTGKLNFNHTNANYLFSADIMGAGAINQVAGTTVLTGNSSTFTGTTGVSGGRLMVNGMLGGTTSVTSGGALGGSGTLTGPVSVASGGALLGVQGQTLGLGSLALSSGSNVNVALGAPGGAGLFNVAGNLTLDGTLNVSNAGGFGAGVYRIFDYGGALTDNGMAVGSVPLGTAGTLQTAVANQVNLLVSGTTLDTQFWNGTTTTADGTIHGGSGVWSAGPATNWTDVNGSTASAWTGNFAVFQNNPGVVTVDTSAGAVSTTGMQFMGQNWSVAGGPVTLNGAGGATTIRVGDGTAAGSSDYAVISSELTGASRLVKDDLGLLVLTGANTYTGGTTVNAGTLQIGANGTSGSIQGDIINNSRLFFARSDAWTLGGAISGSGLISQSSGLTVLTGNSGAFAGSTQVHGGTLQVDGTLGGTTLIQNGGSLAGSGTLSGAVTVANGGTLLGAQGQTLSMGSLALSGASNVNVVLGAPGGAGLFNVAGNLTLDGTLNVSDAGGFGVGVYRLFDYGGALTNNGLDVGLMPTGTTGLVQTSVANKVNLVVNGTGAGSVQFWNGTTTTADGTIHGGAGTWTAGPTTNWTDAAGAQANAWGGNFAVFQSNPDTVTVDGSAGAVMATGMQFIGQGWTVSGAPITLNGANGSTTIRVGDGTAAGATDMAVIRSELTGASRLVKDDLGTLILAGANSYTGGTAINAGTLQIGDGGTTGSILGNVANNGKLAFNRSDATTFDGVISGAGSVDIRSGAVTFTADNGYAGPTTIFNAELRLGNGGTTGSVVGNITNNGKLSFNRSNELIYGGVISGNGDIDHLTGRTVLTGNSSAFTGTTDVIGGQLVVNGSLGGSLSVLSGGTLGGSGTVGNLLVAGTVAPGNSIGTLHVNGNIGFAAGSIYQVEANAAGQADKIVASGTATLNGGTVQVLAGTGIYAPATAYTILSATGGVTGTFTAGVTSNLAFLDPSLTYDANNVYLTLTRNNIDFAGVGLTPNQIAAGGGAESLGFGNPIYNAVLNLSDTQAQYAFDQLSGEIHASARTALIEDSRFVRNAVNDRLRAAFDGVGASGGNVVTYENGKPRTAAANTDGGAFWGQGFGSWGHTNSDGNAARLERSTGGFLMGADAPVFDTWRFGAVAGYSYTDFNVKDRHSSGSADNFHLGLYGGNQWGDLAFRSGLAYTWHDIHTARTIAFPGFSDSTKGGYSAGTFQAFGELGYKVQAGAVQFEPFANLAYVSLNTSGFRETGGAAALTGASATTNATFTTLGLRASTSFDLGGATATAKGMVGWRHAFGDTTPQAGMAFASGGDTFSIGGVPIARNAAVFETGLDIALSPTATVGVTYGGQFGSGVSDQSIKANFNVKF
ncbi:autotransporter domain-containing protein, partial [Shinella zoogloeoides]|nr:autotransporter domain-containing protein [Shinella zoogloeoides]